MAATF